MIISYIRVKKKETEKLWYTYLRIHRSQLQVPTFKISILARLYYLFKYKNSCLSLSKSKRIKNIEFWMISYEWFLNFIAKRTFIKLTFNSQVSNVKDCMNAFGYTGALYAHDFWNVNICFFFLLLFVLLCHLSFKCTHHCVSLLN
jgi:hypothetical protein